jgi:hypothetical protein
MKARHEDKTNPRKVLKRDRPPDNVLAKGRSRTKPLVGFAAHFTGRATDTEIRILEKIVFAHSRTPSSFHAR